MKSCRPVDRLLEAPGLTTVYGPAGAGKTSLALYAVKTACRTTGGEPGKCYYISTEGFQFLERAAKMGVDLEALLVSEAMDLLDLLDILHTGLSKPYMYRLVVVDSVNYAYRLMAGERQAYTLFSYILGFARRVSEKYALPFIATAQVHAKPGEESGRAELEAVGSKPLFFWSSQVIRLERRQDNRRILVVEKPGDSVEAEFEIREDGIEWLNC